MLGIPQTDVKRTRQALYAYLAVYRRYRQQLSQGWSPKLKPPLPGYEKAMDPDLIRRQGPKLGVGSGMTPEEFKEAFVTRVERKVDRLPPYGREVITRRLLTLRSGYRSIHDLRSDTEVLEDMQRAGWASERAYYERQKAEAIQMLAEMLHVAVYSDEIS